MSEIMDKIELLKRGETDGMERFFVMLEILEQIVKEIEGLRIDKADKEQSNE